MYQPSYSIVRRPVDSAFADVMAEVFSSTAKAEHAWSHPKSLGSWSLCLLSSPRIDFAAELTNGCFDVAVFSGELLEAADCTPLQSFPASISSIGLIPSKNSDLRLTAFLDAPAVENETKIAHFLLEQQGLAKKDYKPGVHISVGTISGKLEVESRSRLIEGLSSTLVGTDIELTPAMLRETCINAVTYTELGEISTQGVRRMLELKQSDY